MNRSRGQARTVAATVCTLAILLILPAATRSADGTDFNVEPPVSDITGRETPLMALETPNPTVAPTSTPSPTVMPTPMPATEQVEREEPIAEDAETGSQDVPHDPVDTWEPIEEIPLSDALQRAIFDACELRKVDMALVLGVIERESTFRPDAVNGACRGLMQIHSINHGWLMDDEGIDPTTYEGNIHAGTLMISRHLDEYGDVHLALMAYNCGEAGARKLWSKGIYSTRYSRAVVSSSEQWAAVLNAYAE